MLAIYKKELKSYFHSMIGYVFMAFFLVVIGVYMFAINLVGQSANFDYVLNSIIFVFIILVPILTMRVIAEEKKQKTDQLLYTSAVSMPQIVLAKYLAVVTLFVATMLIVCFYPLILSAYGNVPFVSAYTSILAFTLIGCTLIAIGVFISALTESQIIAAVISFIVLMFAFLANKMATIMPTEKLPTMVITIILWLGFSIVIYLSMRSKKVAFIVAGAGVAAMIVCYFAYDKIYDNLLYKIMSSVALMKRFDNFCFGIVYLADIIYYVSIIALFIVLTTLFMKDNLADKMRKGGTFRTTLMVLLVVICVVLNGFTSQLDVFADFSSNKMFSITQDTIDFVKKVDQKVTLYYLTGEEYKDESVSKIVEKYKGINSKVAVKEIDVLMNPNFVKKYTKDKVMDNTVIVVNEETKKYKIVSYGDMFELNMQTGNIKTNKVESQLTSAIDYVLTDATASLYYTTGHGELDLGKNIISEIERQNVTPNALSTVTVKEIPEDCKVLVINGPTKDFSDDEINMIRVYMANGGDVIICLQQTQEELPNFKDLLKYYGVYLKDGVVIEQDGYYADNKRYVVLPILGEHSIVSSINEARLFVVAPNASAMTASDTARNTITANVLMRSSEGSIAKADQETDINTVTEKDTRGPLDLAILAEEKSQNTGETMSMAVYGSAYMFAEQGTANTSFANTELFGNTLSYMVPMMSHVSISTINMETEYLTIPMVTQIVLGVVIVIVIPLVILITGLVIWLKRRKA